jgi:hypothetical protein
MNVVFQSENTMHPRSFPQSLRGVFIGEIMRFARAFSRTDALFPTTFSFSPMKDATFIGENIKTSKRLINSGLQSFSPMRKIC